MNGVCLICKNPNDRSLRSSSTSPSLRMKTTTIEESALAIAHTNFNTDQSALLAFKAHITSDPQNILTANWSSASQFRRLQLGWRYLRCSPP
ncbi:hypothetical protein DVH24_040130 [Malus domestica]|uniref:Leucine-rich repeat-containing N-terminal plant-type domain-containing protein n=1 Tax=Malus domestica TaxID=3750 RepID=A0A498IS95_MALDO|nr:hypothetical protein DVH24_040130 [Malus domestica]